MTRLQRKTTDRRTEARAPEAAQDTEAGTAGPVGAAGTSTPAGGGDEAGDRAEAAGEGDGHGDDHGEADLRASDSDSGSGSGSDPGCDSRSASRFGRRWRTAAFAAAFAALLLGGSAFFYGAHHLRSAPSAQNRALTDTAATERVSGEVGDGLARIFSYTPTGADATERSARSVLAGRAARQYGDLFAQLRTNLETQKITLITQAVRTGVIELDGNTARLLILLDQTSRRDEGAATSAAAQLTVTARFQGGRWQIVDIKAR
ncbi:hypothetical protein [Streptomyces sp. NBC_01264]|uniref:hypothetical protein n=1 Tax=Streptomyces sp. NBC_01264 TaxID=2903804 RepID=UPI0022589866|nr:hypothetical protein [Streptomyces sp. NBC_01264]MCX4775559.1 hypothetical protein [Streptomyces sp. NBC_01264]